MLATTIPEARTREERDFTALEELSDPGGVIPSQLFPEIRGAAGVEGERRLLSAVLEDAYRCFRRYALASNRRGRTRFREAEEWFMGSVSDAAFTFEYICDVCGLDADSIRSHLRRWREEMIAAANLEKKRQESWGGNPTRTNEVVHYKKASGE